MPKYDIDKIRYGTDEGTFKRAVDLYESGRVTDFQEGIKSYTATVVGTAPYKVFVEDRRFDYGHCTCYLGQSDTLCKHLVAVAMYAVMKGAPLGSEEKKISTKPTCTNQIGTLNPEEFAKQKAAITHALRYIRAYDGPSRTWFAYQGSLDEGCRRLSVIVSSLPVGKNTATLLVNLLLRLDKKLYESGVDDSNGTVGGFMESVVSVLQDFVTCDPSCIDAIATLVGRKTCFGWEEPLVKLYKQAKKTRIR